MEVVACHCLKCKAELGRFRNSWNGIGNTYFSPVNSPLSDDGFECTGDVYEAAQGSQIQDSLLQDLACRACHQVLGLRCDSAPDGHLLHQNQLILRLAEMTVRSDSSGTKAKISIMKTYPLTNPGIRARSQSVLRRASISQSTPRPKPPRLLPCISRTPSNGSRQATPLKTIPQVDVVKFKSWTDAALNSQQEDIDRISSSVDRIEREMRLLKDFMEEVRTELASNRRLQVERDNESVATFRGELDILRQQLSSNPRPVSRGSFEMTNRSLEIIAKDLQQVGRKVDEIDGIKTELQRLRARLKGFESTEATFMEVDVPAREKNTLFQRKRKNSQVNFSDRSLHCGQIERPTKKKKSGEMPVSMENPSAWENNFTLPAQRVNSNARMVVEIISTEEPRSTIPSQDTRARCDDVQDKVEGTVHITMSSSKNEIQFNYVQDDLDNDCPAPDPKTPVSTINRAREEDREFMSTDKTSLSLSERTQHLNKSLELDSLKLDLDVQLGRKRASNGVLLTKTGKIDRRSSRHLGNQENQTPSRSSIAPETPAICPGAVRLPDPFETPVLFSIEQSEPTVGHSSNHQLQADSFNRSTKSKDYKPFACSTCKKQYTSLYGLKYHMEHAKTAACRHDAGNIGRAALEYSRETVAAHEAALAERERLVRQTLDREMSTVL